MEFKDKLRQLMAELKITQTRIVSYTGASKASVSQWYNGDTRPGNRYLPSLCELLHCDAAWLMDDVAAWEDRNKSPSEDLWDQLKFELDRRSVKDVAKLSGLIDKYVDERLSDLQKKDA